MARLTLATILLLALAGSVQMQQGGQNGMQMPQMQNGGMQLPNFMQQMPQMPQMQNMPNSNLLSGLLGGQNGGGLGSTLRNLPARGFQMIGQMLNNVRNILPGLGRGNGSNMMPGQQQFSQLNPFNQMQSMNQGGLNLDNLAKPVTDLLQNGQMPSLNGLSQGLSGTVDGLGRSLSGTLENTIRAN